MATKVPSGALFFPNFYIIDYHQRNMFLDDRITTLYLQPKEKIGREELAKDGFSAIDNSRYHTIYRRQREITNGDQSYQILEKIYHLPEGFTQIDGEKITYKATFRAKGEGMPFLRRIDEITSFWNLLEEYFRIRGVRERKRKI